MVFLLFIWLRRITWTGFALTGVLLLLLSSHHPLRPADMALLAAAAGIAVFAVKDLRRELAAFPGKVSPGLLFNGILLALTAGAVSIQVVSNRDAIHYHYDIIHWLSRHGTVPGLALIHERIGYVSSWHTVPAALNHGILSYRTTTAGSGFALLLALFQLQLSAYRILRRTGSGLDWFMLLSLASVIAPSLLLNYPVSPSPDFAVLLMVLIVTWTVFLAHNPDRAIPMNSKRALLPVMLGAAAMSMKIVALPLLAAALAWLAIGRRRSLWLLPGGILAAAVVLFPALYTWTVVSGCPLLPLPLCFDLPWTVSRAGQSITGFLPFTWKSYSPSFLKMKENIAASTGLAIAAMLNLWLLFCRRSSMIRVWPVLLIGVTGTVFFLAIAPQARFILGYVVIMIFTVPFFLEDAIPKRNRDPLVHHGAAVTLSFAAVLLVTAPPCLLFSTKSEKRIASAKAEERIILFDKHRMLVPPEIPKVIYDDDKGLALPHPDLNTQGLAGGIGERGVFYPLEESGAAEFRVPEKGAGGGFKQRGRD